MTASGTRRVMWTVSILLTVVGATLAAERPITASNVDGRVDAGLAERVARNHVLRYGPDVMCTLSAARPVADADDGTMLYYCFDVSPAGYVIVSAATDLPPVIAYSFTSPAGSDTSADNPLHALLRADLRTRRANVARLPAEVVARRQAQWAQLADGATDDAGERGFQQWPPAGSTSTGGWVVTRWNQSAPYNSLCPTDSVSGSRSVAGCPAVAMAQILNYHGRLNGTHFDDLDDYYHSYAGRNYWIDNAYVARGFPSFPQLNTHLDTLFENYHYGTAPSSTTRAALIFACGVACKQVYTSSGSGTFNVGQALSAFQRFGCDSAELLYAESPGPYTRMAENMMHAYPALLAVVDPSWSSGHNLVVDGYNTDEYYHLNFGWGGSYDGWYLLPSEMPMSLTVIEGIVVDILVDPCAAMDCTCDGVVDAADFVYFEECCTGPAGGLYAPGCTAFDGNDDNGVDMQDLRLFQQVYGPPTF